MVYNLSVYVEFRFTVDDTETVGFSFGKNRYKKTIKNIKVEYALIGFYT